MTEIREIIEKINNEQDLKETLFLLRDKVRDMSRPKGQPSDPEKAVTGDEPENFKEQHLETVRKQREILEQLLTKEDPKIRRAAAQILGEIKSAASLPAIYEAYCREETLYVREDYLKAMAELPYDKLIPDLKQRLEEILQTRPREEHRGHLLGEAGTLFELLQARGAIPPHRYTGLRGEQEVLLTTKEGLQDITIKQLPRIPRKKVPGGVMVKTDDLTELFEIRTYESIFFYMGSSKAEHPEPEELAREIRELKVVDFLRGTHEWNGPMGVRIDLSDPMERSKKGAYIKRIGQELTVLSNGAIINTTSGYEAQILLQQTAGGGHRVLVELFTLPRKRFAYRKETVATSIKPYFAATLLQMAKGYLKEGAQVLDPYCGVGTMLIERRAVLPTGDCYGVDSFGEAIAKARINSEKIGPYIHYIQRDFGDFTHSYLFDEIITDMPVASKNVSRQEIRHCYELLFTRGKELLREGGIMVVYGNEHGLMKQQLRQNKEFNLLREYDIEQRLDTHLYVLGYKTGQRKKHGTQATE